MPETDFSKYLTQKKAAEWYNTASEVMDSFFEDYDPENSTYSSADSIRHYQNQLTPSLERLSENYQYAEKFAAQLPDEEEKNSYTQMLQKMKKALDAIPGNLDQEATYWSQWDSQEEYDAWKENQELLSLSKEELQQKIAENEQRIEELNNQKVSAAPSGKVTGIFNSLVSDKQKEVWESEGNPTMDELLKQRRELEAQQEELKGRYANYYYTVDNRSKLAEIQADEDMSTLYQSAKDLQSDMDKVNAVAADALYHDGGRAAAEYKEYLQSKYGLTQEAIDQYVIGGRNANFTDDGYGNIWQLYDELENRLAQIKTDLQSQGYDYDRISGYEQRLADEKAYDQKQEEYQEYATAHPVLSSIDSVLVSPFQGIDYLRYGLDYLENRGHNDVNDPENYVPLNAYTMEATNLVSAIRGTVSQNIEKSTNWELLGQNVGSFLYQTGMSIADSAAQVAALGNASILFMGASAASNKTRDILLDGGTNDQAFWGGLAAGAAEAIFEKFSVDQLLKPKAVLGWKSVVKEVAKQAGVEASEEMATEIANILSDTAIMGNTSEFSKSVRGYMHDGMSEEEAKKQAFLDCIGQVVLAGAGGFISGGVMGGGAAAVNAYNAYSTGKNFDVRTLSEADINVFIEEGLASAPDTASHQLAAQLREKLDNGGKVTNYELGQLYQQNRLAIENERSGDSIPTVFERAVNRVMNRGKDSSRVDADTAAANTVTTMENSHQSADSTVRGNLAAEQGESSGANIPAAHNDVVNRAAADNIDALIRDVFGYGESRTADNIPADGRFTNTADADTMRAAAGGVENGRAGETWADRGGDGRAAEVAEVSRFGPGQGSRDTGGSAETVESFLSRVRQTAGGTAPGETGAGSGTAGNRSDVRIRRVGDRIYAYAAVPVQEQSRQARETQKALAVYGIPSEIVSWSQSNAGGITTTMQGEASTLADGTVFIKNDAGILKDGTAEYTPREMAGHEMAHAAQRRTPAEYQAYYDALTDGNIDFSNETFLRYYSAIEETYFVERGKPFDFTQDYPLLYDEFAAFVSGSILNGEASAVQEISSMFYDFDSVVEAWKRMESAMRRQGGQSTTQADSGKTESAFLDTSVRGDNIDALIRDVFGYSEGSGNTGRGVDSAQEMSNTQDAVAMSQDEQEVLYAYKSSESYKINDKLRGNEPLNAQEQQFVELLDSAIEKLPVFRGEVYRNLVFDDFGGKSAFDAFMEQNAEGYYVAFSAYSSASTAIDGYPVEGTYTAHMIMQSERAHDVEGFGNNFESEVIFARDSLFFIEKVTTDEMGTPTIYAREVVADEKGEYGQLYPAERGDAVHDVRTSYPPYTDLQGISGWDSEGNIIWQSGSQQTVSGRQRHTEGTDQERITDGSQKAESAFLDTSARDDNIDALIRDVFGYGERRTAGKLHFDGDRS
ncbi:MAG: ADP-ribosyltransferase, partial [Acutalibacteraceae bacterium]